MIVNSIPGIKITLVFFCCLSAFNFFSEKKSLIPQPDIPNVHPLEKFSGNPILVIGNDQKFGSYTGEILRAEGFNEFDMDSLNDQKISLKYIKQFDVVILSEVSLNSAQKEMFERFVQEGGNLIAFRPDKKLSGVFGITFQEGSITNGYLSISDKGMISESLQIHGDADKVEPVHGKKLAGLFKDARTATEYPAVIMNNFGKGHAMAFLYNLPQNIVYTRQGNLHDAAEEMDGIVGIRAMDLFTNGWVDTTKNIINQADEQMRLLTRCIEKMNSYIKPLPRFWYFPDTLKCVVTLNNDGEDSKQIEFQPQFEDVDAKNAKMTLYIKEVDFVSKQWTDAWGAKGFEISGHPDDTKQAPNPDWNTMDSVFKSLNEKLKNEYGVGPMRTVTNHWFVWCGKNADGTKDFAAQARIEAINGVRLDCNYAHYYNNSSQGHFLGAFGTYQGNYTGSGLPMKFADVNGKMINVFQQINNVYDQQYMEHKDQDGYFNACKGLMDRSMNDEVYSYISVKAHNNEYFFSKIPLMKMLDYANSKRVPVWTEMKLLDFLTAKHEASFSDIHWTNNVLSFTLNSSLKHTNGLTSMIPYLHKEKKITGIQNNGATQSYSLKRIKGMQYAFITNAPGNNYNIKITYSN